MNALQLVYEQYGNIIALIIAIPTLVWVVSTQMRTNDKRRKLNAECEQIACSGLVKPPEVAKPAGPPFIADGVDATACALE